MILDTVQPENRGLKVGLLRTTGDVGIIVSPLLVGSLLDVGHIISIFYVIAGISGIFTITMNCFVPDQVRAPASKKQIRSATR